MSGGLGAFQRFLKVLLDGLGGAGLYVAMSQANGTVENCNIT